MKTGGGSKAVDQERVMRQGTLAQPFFQSLKITLPPHSQHLLSPGMRDFFLSLEMDQQIGNLKEVMPKAGCSFPKGKLYILS
jgi:hypothetical protein